MIAPLVIRVVALIAALAVIPLPPAGVSAGRPQQGAPAAPDPGPRTADPGSASAPPYPLVLAVVRNDGILLPFAAFNGRKWSAPWPSLQRNFGPTTIELPVNLASVPREWWGGKEPGAWRLWPRNSETSRPLTLSTPAMIQIGLTRQIGFRTDQPPVLPPVPPFELPFPKIGIAVAGDTPVTPILSVSLLSAAWKTFAGALLADINKAEDRTLSAISASTSWRHPVKREVRAEVPPEFEAWYVMQAGTGDQREQRLSYIEAVKKYPLQPEDEGCGLETFVSGWVHPDGNRTKTKASLNAVVTYCDRRGVSYMLPFGQMRVNDRAHWIVQMSGRDHEWYAVVEAATERIKYVAEFQAGSLPLPR
jgi:hypothetical protein